MLDDLPGTYGRRPVMSGSFGSSRVHTEVESPLGKLTLVREGERIAGLYFEHHWYRPSQSSFGPRVDDGFDTIMCQLKEYFSGRRQTFDLPTLLAGTCEQVAVWRLLSRIPYGQGAIRCASSSRAIESSGASGDLTGYAGGLARKRALLELEEALPVPSQQPMLAFDKVADTPGDQRLRLTGRSVVGIG
jgi:methylated-DNA-[protein]-cysteine S-methyltransferase